MPRNDDGIFVSQLNDISERIQGALKSASMIEVDDWIGGGSEHVTGMNNVGVGEVHDTITIRVGLVHFDDANRFAIIVKRQSAVVGEVGQGAIGRTTSELAGFSVHRPTFEALVNEVVGYDFYAHAAEVFVPSHMIPV